MEKRPFASTWYRLIVCGKLDSQLALLMNILKLTSADDVNEVVIS